MARPSTRRLTVAITSGASVILLALAALMLGGNWPRATLRGHVGPVYAIAFSPDGSTLASQGADRTVRLWDVASGTSRTIIPESKKPDWFHPNPRLSPDGKLLAGLVTEKGDWRITRLTLTDPITGETHISMTPHPDQVNDLAFSPDGRLFATGGGYTDHPWPVNAAGDVRIWDVRTGRLLVTLKRHWGAVSAVAFSPDGRTLATASYDGTIKLWDMDSLPVRSSTR